MRITHQIKGMKIEKDVDSSAPLEMFFSNKQGSMLFYDVAKDSVGYYARVGCSVLKVIDDICFEGGLSGVVNRFHSLGISRKGGEYDLFVPHYMDAFMVTGLGKQPVELVFDVAKLGCGSVKDCSVTEKNGLVVLTFSRSEGGAVSVVVIGDCMSYDSKKSKGQLLLHVLSPRFTVAVSDDEDGAVRQANHLLENSDRIMELQEGTLPAKQLGADDASLAYACALNGIDNMFLHGSSSVMKKRFPFFSDLSGLHAILATNAFLSDGEFRMVKQTLDNEFHEISSRLTEGKADVHEVAWPLYLLGKFMNRLCAHDKLYNYYSPEEIKGLSTRMVGMIGLIEHNSMVSDKIDTLALLASLYDLAYSLTKSEKYGSVSEGLRKRCKDILLDDVFRIRKTSASIDNVFSVFMTAYVCPNILTQSEWTECFDIVLDRFNHNFKSLRGKMPARGKSAVDIELFGLSSLAAIVLRRVDAKRYASVVGDVVRMNTSETLFKGLIGRPSSSYDLSVDPSNAFIGNRHLMNNVLFVELLRECA
ncbi:hypothetical protein ACFL3V_04310 [Nanoarchaeota archaeon]